MMGKRLAVHGALAILTLIGAYLAYRHDASVEDESVSEEAEATIVVAEIERAALSGLRFTDEQRTVEIDLGGDEAGPHMITVTTKTKIRRRPPQNERPAASDADAGLDGGPASSDGGVAGDAGLGEGDAAPMVVADESSAAEPEPQWKTVRTVFAGNENLDTLIGWLTPLKAVQKLGQLEPEQLEEFELDDPDAALELKLAQGERRIDVGGRTFGAGSHYYVLDERTGEVYLLNAKLINGLRMAQNELMQRELHRFERSEIVEAVVRRGDRQTKLIHDNRHSETEDRWVLPGAAESLPAANAWMGKLLRLRALAYLEGDEDFDAASVETIFRVELRGENGTKLGQVALGYWGRPKQYVAQSEATGSWVRVSLGQGRQLASDVGELLGGE